MTTSKLVFEVYIKNAVNYMDYGHIWHFIVFFWGKVKDDFTHIPQG